MNGDLFTNPPIIGPKEMQRLLDAVPFYERAGFQYTNTSWVAEPGVIAVTKPAHVKDFQLAATAVANKRTRQMERPASRQVDEHHSLLPE